MSLLIRTVLYRGLSDAPSIATVFPGMMNGSAVGGGGERGVTCVLMTLSIL